MEFIEDWDALRSVIEGKKKVEITKREREEGEIPKEFMINRTDLAIIKTLLRKGKSSLRDLREDADRSRVSIYLSIKRLKRLSLIEGDRLIELKKNPLVDSIANLFNQDFSLEKLLGERLLILQSLMDWKEPDQIAVECGMSTPSVYRYLRELRPLIKKSGRAYRVDGHKKSLIEFLKLVKNQIEIGSKTFRVWSSSDGKLLKTIDAIDGSLTAFSRFPEFDVDYSSDYFYYHVPRKELDVEEIFIHSLRFAEDDKDDRMLPKIVEFYIKNNDKLDIFKIDELALRFNVADFWLDLQAHIVGTNPKNDDPEGDLPYYSSPEDTFLSRSLSNTLGDILRCEEIMKKEELDWEMLFREYVLRQGYPDFRWNAIISRLQILEQRTGIKIPILKKLSNVYLERAIVKAIKEPKSVNELRTELNIPEYRIRNILTRMVKTGFVQKIETKPLKFVSSMPPEE